MKILVKLLVFVLIGSLSLNAQENSYEKKVKKMLELSGSVKKFNVALTNMIEFQKETFGKILGDVYFTELETEMKGVGLELLLPKFTPVYKKYLTERDLDGIIAFYESEAGQKLIDSTPLIIKAAFDIGTEWGEEIAKRIKIRIENSNELKFNKKIVSDCSSFRKGKFTEKNNTSNIIIERLDNIQIERTENDSLTLGIEWILDNKYLLTKLNESPDLESQYILEVNIYEVIGNSYRWIAKRHGENYFLEGELTKIE